LQPGSVTRPAAAAALTIDLISPLQPDLQRHGLRLGGDLLHLPLLGAIGSDPTPELAFHAPGEWGLRLLADQLDVVLLGVAGASADPASSQPPPLPDALAPGLEAIRLGQRPLLLFHQPRAWATAIAQWPANASRHPAGAMTSCPPPTGYLLPPAAHSPLLHTTLTREARLPLHCCAASDPTHWLALLQLGTLLLPAHLSLLTLEPWRAAGLQPLRPLRPLNETLWLLLRRGESSDPKLAALLEWWGCHPLSNPRQAPARRKPWPAGMGRWWPWRRC
jgi:hypothetical protein